MIDGFMLSEAVWLALIAAVSGVLIALIRAIFSDDDKK